MQILMNVRKLIRAANMQTVLTLLAGGSVVHALLDLQGMVPYAKVRFLCTLTLMAAWNVIFIGSNL